MLPKKLLNYFSYSNLNRRMFIFNSFLSFPFLSFPFLYKQVVILKSKNRYFSNVQLFQQAFTDLARNTPELKEYLATLSRLEKLGIISQIDRYLVNKNTMKIERTWSNRKYYEQSRLFVLKKAFDNPTLKSQFEVLYKS